MSKFLLVIFILTISSIFVPLKQNSYADNGKATWWSVQSIDTVKYSRDVAREKAKSVSFDQTIDLQVSRIAQTGATHIALGTPYNKEFVPYLKRWINAARNHGLNVWFRGNVSGWEGWFGYPKISREAHIKAIRTFILDNGDLFQNGDIFSPCTECENGGPGDPRTTGDTVGYRRFLIEEYRVTQEAFRKVGKNVVSNYPMNGDVARLIMDQETTKALGGVVVIDHYVASPSQLASDIKALAAKSGGKVILGEFGAPIPGIHGSMTESEQAAWIKDALTKLSTIPAELFGINYWTSFGGSTELWNPQGKAHLAVDVIHSYYSPRELTGVVKNELGQFISGALISSGMREVETDSKGRFSLPYVTDTLSIRITAKTYTLHEQVIKPGEESIKVVLTKEHESILFRILKWFFTLIANEPVS